MLGLMPRYLVALALCVMSAALVAVPTNFSLSLLYTTPELPYTVPLLELQSRGYAQVNSNSCLTEANKPKHSVNKLVQPSASDQLLPGTTYWFNEYMHVGHVPYNLGLIQVLVSARIDRIVMQRAACNAQLCHGLGTYRSFWSAYFAAALEAANQSHVPLYIRWAWTERAVNPNYVSVSTADYETTRPKSSDPPIPLKPTMCFERVVQRGKAYYGNYFGSVSAEAMNRLKAAAYASLPVMRLNNPERPSPPPMHFERGAPIRILVSYRGATASRHFENPLDIVLALRKAFPEPKHIVEAFDNSVQTLTAEYQILAMARSNIVITNHGAFEGNVVYMRNGSLLVELSGNYHNSEFSMFEQLAQQSGVFYSRLATKELLYHQQDAFNITDDEIREIVATAESYIRPHGGSLPYAHNLV